MPQLELPGDREGGHESNRDAPHHIGGVTFQMLLRVDDLEQRIGLLNGKEPVRQLPDQGPQPCPR